MIKIENNTDYLANLTRILCDPDFRRVLTERPSSTASPLARARLRPTPAPLDTKVVCAQTLANLRELFAAGKEGLKRGIRIPFAEICAQKQFDEIESAAFALYAAVEISGRDQFELVRGAESVLKSLAALFAIERITLTAYFLSTSKLRKSGVFSREYYALDDAFRLPSNLKEEIIEKLLTGDRKSIENTKRTMEILRPGSISKKLSLNVIAQEAAKRQLSTVAFQHLQRAGTLAKPGLAAPRLNTILIGPTGCGKTYITRRLAEILEAPIVFCDATQYTETGYVGACVEEMLVQLQTIAGSAKASEYGIIFIDEIDKIASRNTSGGHNSNRDVSGLCVQQDLLKILEGETLSYEKIRGSIAVTYKFNVKNILFIAAGAFQGLESIISERVNTKSRIGFNGSPAAREASLGGLLRQARPQDIIKYGFMPEFVGRFPNLIAFDQLTKEDFLGILGNPRTSLVEHYRDLLTKHGVELEIPSQFYEEIAAKAVGRELGARGLNAAIEGFFSDLIFDLLERRRTGEIQKVNVMDCIRGGQLKELLG